MTSNAMLKPEPTPIVACTISRDVSNFDMLIEDMEAVMGNGWGDLTFTDARVYFNQPDADLLEFVAIAIDHASENELAAIANLVSSAKEKDIKVILVAKDVSPSVLHQLLRLGAADFIPYPLPDGELRAAVERIRAPAQAPALAPMQVQPETVETVQPRQPQGSYSGIILPVHGLAGGTGATTFAVNLAWELANSGSKEEEGPRVCLIDLDLQFGSVSTYLDLPRRDNVFALLSDVESMDSASFMQAMVKYEEKLHVLTAPFEMLPLDMLDVVDITRILDTAKSNFDFIIIDMPSTLVNWTETVLNACNLYFAMIGLDMRSAQNAMRFMRLMASEGLPAEKLRFALNRAPKFTDMNGKNRVKRMAESLEIAIELQLPDGGKPILQAGDKGVPLAIEAPKNLLRKEILNLASSVLELKPSKQAVQQ